MNNLTPPRTHPRITMLPTQGEICLVDSLQRGENITPSEAVSLGLALMEAGLYLKAKQKS